MEIESSDDERSDESSVLVFEENSREAHVLKIFDSIRDGCIDVLVDYFFKYVAIMEEDEKDQVTATIEVRMNERVRSKYLKWALLVCQLNTTVYLFRWNRNLHGGRLYHSMKIYAVPYAVCAACGNEENGTRN